MKSFHALFVLGAVAFAGDPAAIEWAPDLETAFERSKEDGRPVIAYFTFDT